MIKKGVYEGLTELLEKDPSARSYYGSLPDWVREHIDTRRHNVNSLESLKDYADNLLRGDI